MEEKSEGLEVLSPSGVMSGDIDVQIATARRYPRSIAEFQKGAITLVTHDKVTAESMEYSLPRKDTKTGKIKAIKGPSVRLAEIAAICYGNTRVSAECPEPGPQDRFVVATGVAIDLQTNSAAKIQVHRRITTRDGRRYSDDGVQQAMGAARSIAYREAAFRIIPRPLLTPIIERAKAVAFGKGQSIGDSVKKALAYFKGKGLNTSQVCALVDKPSEKDIDVDDLRTLAGYRTALEDGEMTAEGLLAIVTEPAKKEELDLDDVVEGEVVSEDNAKPPSKTKK